MKTINLKLYELDRLKRFHPNTRFIGTESRLYLYPENNRLRIIKEIIDFNQNKLITIKLLNQYKKEINIKELILDNDILEIESKKTGTVTDYIEGTILSNIIYDKNIQISYKIDLLKKIGAVLEKMKAFRNNGIESFYIGDLHEDNIIITNDNDIRILDMDSSKIMYNEPFPSKYLTRFARRKKLENHLITPNENTDNYCFNMMILNALFSKDISKLKIDDFYSHIDYLNSIGIDKNLINNFYSMYNDSSVLNLNNELDSLKKHDKIYLK